MNDEHGRAVPLWLVDWSDSENEDFQAACASAGVPARVVRGRPLGVTAGTRLHRLHSWPAYVRLGLRGLRLAGNAPVIAWQPLAGAAAALARRGREPGLVVLNPLLDPGARSARQRVVLAGLRRADRVLFYTRGGLEAAGRAGLDPCRLRFVPLGVQPRRTAPAPPGDYLLAAGREERDWETLAEAARGLSIEIHVLAPTRVPPPLVALPQVDRKEFFALLDGARAFVVPLRPAQRAAGQLAVLDAMSVGRAVVATQGQGTEDYVKPETGLLVPPGDPVALRSALEQVMEPGVPERMGNAALAATRGPLSLERFVQAVDDAARELEL